MDFATFDWRGFLRNGAIAGGALLYVGVVGMLADFNEREVVRDIFTIGQLLIVFLPFIVTYYTHRRNRTGYNTTSTSPAEVLLGGLIIGAIAIVPTLVMLLLQEGIDIREILVNVNRDWLDTITFDNRRELVTGSLIFSAVVISSTLLASAVSLLPEKLQRGLLYGTGAMLLVGILGETFNLIAEEILPEDLLDSIFRRDTLLPTAALILFILTNAGAIGWSYFGGQAGERYSELPQQNKTVFRYIGWVLLAILLLALPFLIGRTLSDVAVLVGLFVLMGFGLNIAIGLAGLLDLGYVTNYAVGAYVMAVLTSTGVLGRGGDFLTFWMVIPIALLAAMAAGFIFAVPVLKMRGDYLAIATLGFGEIIAKLAISDWFSPVIGGAQGVLAIPKPVFFGTELKNPEQLYYIVLAACVVTLFVSIRLNNSRTGRQWMAIREDEDVAEAMGINVARAKLLAFTLSAATGGVAGAIFAVKVGTVFPNSFTVFISINVLSLIIVGGMGSNPGIVVGAIALVGMPELLREFSEYRWLLYGALLIFMMVNRPEGLWPSAVRLRELDKDEPPPQAATAPAGAGD